MEIASAHKLCGSFASKSIALVISTSVRLSLSAIPSALRLSLLVSLLLELSRQTAAGSLGSTAKTMVAGTLLHVLDMILSLIFASGLSSFPAAIPQRPSLISAILR